MASDSFRELFEAASEAMVGVGASGGITLFNSRAEEIFGYVEEEILGELIEVLIPDLLCDVHAENRINLMRYGGQRRMGQGRDLVARKKDGSEFPVEVGLGSVEAHAGTVVLAIVADITQRKQTEDALRESQELYRKLFESAPVGIGIADLQGNLIAFNEAMLQPGGYTKADIERIKNVANLYVSLEARDEALSLAGRQGYLSKHEVLFKRMDGSAYDALLSLIPVTHGGEGGWLALVEDVTERKRAEAQLRSADKLATLGMVVSGVSHEVSNPLTGVKGLVDLLLRQPLDAAIERDLHVIQQQIDRAIHPLKNLLVFSREHETEKDIVSLNDVIEAAIELHAYQLETSNIEIHRNLAPNLPTTLADPNQVQQLLLNLILNAEQAMFQTRGHGTLSVTSRAVEDEIVQLIVADDGPGIAVEHLAKVFDPFFTTKSVGEGTGLGLSICYGIVKEHGGDIWVESTLGKGAAFTVEIPITLDS